MAHAPAVAAENTKTVVESNVLPKNRHLRRG